MNEHSDRGRLLPDPGWPADRAAPGELELIRRFCNTINREHGADRFTTPAGFDRWLATESLAAVRPSRADLERIGIVRDALHDLTVANRERRPAPDAWRRIAGMLQQAAYVIAADDDGLVLVPRADAPVDAFLAHLALICGRARDDGTFGRLTSCAHCEWTLYDSSKNRNGRWCALCGGRHNARAYRQRQRRSDTAVTQPAPRAAPSST